MATEPERRCQRLGPCPPCPYCAEWIAELEDALRHFGVHVFEGNDGRKHLGGTGLVMDDDALNEVIVRLRGEVNRLREELEDMRRMDGERP